jgi:hypothetical protein
MLINSAINHMAEVACYNDMAKRIYGTSCWIMGIKVSFIIGGIVEEDFEALKEGYSINTKLILSQQDHELFHYNKGNGIQVESAKGDRLWCIIRDLEMIVNAENTLVMFTLVRETDPE